MAQPSRKNWPVRLCSWWPICTVNLGLFEIELYFFLCS